MVSLLTLVQCSVFLHGTEPKFSRKQTSFLDKYSEAVSVPYVLVGQLVFNEVFALYSVYIYSLYIYRIKTSKINDVKLTIGMQYNCIVMIQVFYITHLINKFLLLEYLLLPFHCRWELCYHFRLYTGRMLWTCNLHQLVQPITTSTSSIWQH